MTAIIYQIYSYEDKHIDIYMVPALGRHDQI